MPFTQTLTRGQSTGDVRKATSLALGRSLLGDLAGQGFGLMGRGSEPQNAAEAAYIANAYAEFISSAAGSEANAETLQPLLSPFVADLCAALSSRADRPLLLGSSAGNDDSVTTPVADNLMDTMLKSCTPASLTFLARACLSHGQTSKPLVDIMRAFAQQRLSTVVWSCRDANCSLL